LSVLSRVMSSFLVWAAGGPALPLSDAGGLVVFTCQRFLSSRSLDTDEQNACQVSFERPACDFGPPAGADEGRSKGDEASRTRLRRRSHTVVWRSVLIFVATERQGCPICFSHRVREAEERDRAELANAAPIAGDRAHPRFKPPEAVQRSGGSNPRRSAALAIRCGRLTPCFRGCARERSGGLRRPCRSLSP
jgi:hypothetical protein